MKVDWKLTVVCLLVLAAADCSSAEKNDLQAYLDDIKFDTASHQKNMRKKISEHLCPQLRTLVGSIASEQE